MKTFNTAIVGDNVAYRSKLNDDLLFGRIIEIYDNYNNSGCRLIVIVWTLEEKELFLSYNLDYPKFSGEYTAEDMYVKDMFFFNTEKELLNIKIKT